MSSLADNVSHVSSHSLLGGVSPPRMAGSAEKGYEAKSVEAKGLRSELPVLSLNHTTLLRPPQIQVKMPQHIMICGCCVALKRTEEMTHSVVS